MKIFKENSIVKNCANGDGVNSGQNVHYSDGSKKILKKRYVWTDYEDWKHN